MYIKICLICILSAVIINVVIVDTLYSVPLFAKFEDINSTLRGSNPNEVFKHRFPPPPLLPPPPPSYNGDINAILREAIFNNMNARIKVRHCSLSFALQ